MSTDTPTEHPSEIDRPPTAFAVGRVRRIVSGSVGFAVVRLSSVLVSIVTIPLALSHLGKERYGLWMALSGIVQMLTFADFGLGAGLMNVAAAERDNPERVRRVFSDTFFSLWTVAIVWGLASLVIAPLIPWAKLFGVRTPIAIAESLPAIWALLGCTLVNIPVGLVNRIQLGRQEGALNAAMATLNTVGQLGGTIVALRMNLSLPWVIVGFTAPIALGNLLNLVWELGWRSPELRPRLSDWTYRGSATLVRIGLSFLLLQALGSLTQWSDYIIVGSMVGAEANAAYSVAFRVFSVATIASYASRSLWPAFAEAVGRGDMDFATRLFDKVNRFGLVFGLTGAAFLPFVASAIIGKWVGKGLVVPFSMLAAFGGWLLVMNMVEGLSALAMGDLFRRIHTLYTVIASVATFFVRIVLVKLTGTNGVIYGATVCFGLLYVVPMFILMRRRLHGGEIVV